MRLVLIAAMVLMFGLLASAATAPALPAFVDNNELVCEATLQCSPNSPGLGYTPAAYEYLLGASTWITGPPPSCSFSLPYAATASGWQSFINAMEACRTAQGYGIILDLPPGLYSTSSSIIVPQTSTSLTRATSPLIVRSEFDSTLASMPEPVCAGGIQTNVSASLNIGVRNPNCDGQNTAALSVECPSGGALAYQLGNSTLCIPSGAFTLANGLNPFPATLCPILNTSCYNYAQYMPNLQATGITGPLIFCSVAPGNNQACGAGAHFGPDLWLFEDIEISDAPGNTANMNLVSIDDRSGNSTVIASWPSHIHFRRVWFNGDWQNLNVGYTQIASGMAISSCNYCSVIGSQGSELLRPSSEGHVMSVNGTNIKLSNNWLEGQSSCIFSGGNSNAPSITPIGSFVPAQDVQDTRNRCTFPLAWLGSPYGSKGGNVPNANPYWGGAGDNPAALTTVNIDTTGLQVTYASGPQFHDSTSFWPGNNVFLTNASGTSLSCPASNGGAGTKPAGCALVVATSWPQKCTVPPSGTNCFPTDPPTQLTLKFPACVATGSAGAWSCPGSIPAVTGGNFIVNGASIARKNGDEKKSWQRYLKAGGFVENVDPSGGQRGIAAAFSNRQTSGGAIGTNYQATGNDLNVQNMIYQNACEDVSVGGRSNPAPGDGGGTDQPFARLSFWNVAHLNITNSIYNCSTIGASNGMNVNVGNESWTGTVTENGAGTAATFIATASVDAGAPLESDTIGSASYSSPNLTITVTNTFVSGENVSFPAAGNPGDSGNACLENLVFPLSSVTSSQIVINIGTGCSATLSGGATVQGPAGFQQLGIPTGFPVAMSGCMNTGFNTSTTSVGPATAPGSSAWTGYWFGTSPGPTAVTYPWTATANASTTCTLSNVQGVPQGLTLQKQLFITDVQAPLGVGNSAAGNGAPYGTYFALQDSILLNSGGIGQKAGWMNTDLGGNTEGTTTEIFNADKSTMTASNTVIPRVAYAPCASGSVSCLYTEFGNNTLVAANPCAVPAGCTPTTIYFPYNTSGGGYSSCLLGWQASCSAPLNISLALGDPHGYNLAPTSLYATAASDGGPIGVLFNLIDAAQTANTYVPQVMGIPVSVSVGPFPDELVVTPPTPQIPTAPAAKVFVMLQYDHRPSSPGGTE